MTDIQLCWGPCSEHKSQVTFINMVTLLKVSKLINCNNEMLMNTFLAIITKWQTVTIIPMFSKHQHCSKLLSYVPHKARVFSKRLNFPFIASVEKYWSSVTEVTKTIILSIIYKYFCDNHLFQNVSLTRYFCLNF